MFKAKVEAGEFYIFDGLVGLSYCDEDVLESDVAVDVAEVVDLLNGFCHFCNESSQSILLSYSLVKQMMLINRNLMQGCNRLLFYQID